MPDTATPADWMCEPCIEKHHDRSLINEETQELVNVLAGDSPEIATRLQVASKPTMPQQAHVAKS